MLDPAVIWAAVIAFAVLAYVILDGFDLGVGILYPLLRGETERDIAMNSVAPVWDGNETWLVMGGGGLLAVFPLAYATILPALYIPLTVMLLALVFRGVAFEFRWRVKGTKRWWDAAFTGGSTLAAFAQGVVLGGLVQGIEVRDRAFAGGPWDWLTPFSLTTGLALVIGYGLLGATWLVYKTHGDLQARANRIARASGIAMVALMGVVSLWTPLLNPAFWTRWMSMPAVLLSLAMPILTLGCALWGWRALARGYDLQPFLAAIGLFVLSYIGLGVAFYPYIVPTSVTIWQAAAPAESLWFLLVGAVVLVPVILGYTAYAYWVFRGKVDPEEGYH